MEAKSNKLSASEFESLKRFAIAWLAFYNFAPPETMLRLFIFYRRLIVSLERVQASVSTITISLSDGCEYPKLEEYDKVTNKTKKLKTIDGKTISIPVEDYGLAVQYDWVVSKDGKLRRLRKRSK